MDQSSRAGSAPDAAAGAIVDGVYGQVMGMFSALWASRERNKIVLLGGGLIRDRGRDRLFPGPP